MASGKIWDKEVQERFANWFVRKQEVKHFGERLRESGGEDTDLITKLPLTKLVSATLTQETIAAAVVLKDGLAPDQEDLRKLVRGRLRSSRVPEFIRFVPELPYNETGKLLRRVVKEGFE